jgi:uncharacterized membrane protein
MARLDLSTDVGVPPATVFGYVDDHENYSEFMHGFQNFDWKTRRHEVGTRLKMEGKAAGVTVPMELETTEVVPERKLAWRFVSGMSGQGEWLFEPTPNGTHVTCKFDYELPMGILGKVADRAIVERDIRANLERTLNSLKKHLEAKQPIT